MSRDLKFQFPSPLRLNYDPGTDRLQHESTIVSRCTRQPGGQAFAHEFNGVWIEAITFQILELRS